MEKIRRCFNNAYKFLRDYEDFILEKEPDDTICLANLCEKKFFHGSDFIDVPAIAYSEGMTDTELLQYYRYAIAQQMEQEGVNPSYAEWIIPHYYGGFCYCCYVKCDLGCSVDCGGVLEGIYPKREDYNSSIWTTDYVIECIGNN